MENTFFSEMKNEAEKKIIKEMNYAEKVRSVVESRMENTTMSSLLWQIMAIVVWMTGFICIAYYFEEQVVYTYFVGKGINLVVVSAIAVTIIFSITMITRYIVTIKFYRAIFVAAKKVDNIWAELDSKLRNLNLRITQVLQSREENWNLNISIVDDVESQLYEIETKVVDKGELRVNVLDKITLIFFYLGVAIWLGMACSVSFPYMSLMSEDVFGSLDNMCDTKWMIKLALPVTGMAVSVGIVLTFWLVHICLKYFSYKMSWWSPILWGTGLIAVWGMSLIFYLMGLVLGILVGLFHILVDVAVFAILIIVIIGIVAAILGG